ncbi:MAG TPA: transglycosylase SLT domain-containing protein [Blastocatellia bacterium]|nr:transglycosylase SLT domain-containing protein [Blastocatellia bacterium]
MQHNRIQLEGFWLAVAMALLTVLSASAQTTDDDPAARAMQRIQSTVDERAAAAERVLAASRFVNEGVAAKQQGQREQARAALQQAQTLLAASAEQSVLTEALLRRIAEEQTALNPAPPKTGWTGLKPAGTRVVLARYHNYQTSLTRILREEQLPVEVLSVALVESGFNPLALSPKGARGLWQLMPATARRYGLTVEPDNDHRIHPEFATRAAARYLRDLYRLFGDWPLALAAYNAGEGRVQRIIKQTGLRTFEEMARRGLLPLETRKYVPAVLAAWSQMNEGRAK